jgi:hypothetical protein
MSKKPNGGHLKVCAPNNANSDKPRTKNSNGLIASAELGFEMFGRGQSGLLLGDERHRGNELAAGLEVAGFSPANAIESLRE